MRSAAIGLMLGLGLGACFTPGSTEPCPEGSEGCPCLELQCEAGLVCQNAMCVAGEGTGTDGTSGTPTTTTPDPTTGPGPTTGPTSADSTDTSASGPDSSGTDPSTDDGGSSTGVTDTCGNGALDADEECDGTPGCTETCELENYDCNPLNNVPCGKGFKCSVVEPGGIETLDAVCLPFAMEPPTEAGDMPPGQLHDGNCFYDFEPHDEWCDVGLACALGNATEACSSNCCVEFCDLTDAGFACGFPGDTCQPFFTPMAPPGLAQLGYCIAP